MSEHFLHCGPHRLPLGERTLIMGIINMAPDSFSGDGLNGDAEAALRLGEWMLRAGADILDVGGESTRPGHQPIDEAVEIERVIPAVARLAGELGAPVSIDTRHSQVARAALAAGASLINDVSTLQDDPALASVAAEFGCPIVLCHWARGPRKPGQDIVERVVCDLRAAVDRAMAAGVAADRIIVDPGIGFGKIAEESLEVLRRLDEVSAALPYPLLVGPSRKSFIGKVLGVPTEARLEGTAAAVTAAIVRGADIVRVHDVLPMARVARVADAIVRGWTPPS